MIEITIPVYNEEDSLEEKVLEARNFIIDNLSNDFKIKIVDNGSNDKTQDIGVKLSSEYDDIDYLRLNIKGVGLALRTSWLKSEADVVGYMDLDLATELKHLVEVENCFHDSSTEIVNGSRLKKGSVVKNRKLIRKVTSVIFNSLLKIMFNVKFTDGMCGFKFFKREIAQNLIKNKNIVTNSWFFSTEILIKAEWSGNKIIEIPVHWTDDINSKVKIVSLSLNYLKSMYRLKKEKYLYK